MSGNDWRNRVCLLLKSRQRIGRRDIVRKPIPELCCCDRKRSTADGWQFERRNLQTVWSNRAECSATCTSEHRQRGAPPCRALYIRTAVLYSIRSGARNQWRLISVVARFQMIHHYQTGGWVQDRLELTWQVSWQADQHAISIVQSGVNQSDHQHLECGCRNRVADLTQLTQRGKTSRYNTFDVRPHRQVTVNIQCVSEKNTPNILAVTWTNIFRFH